MHNLLLNTVPRVLIPAAISAIILLAGALICLWIGLKLRKILSPKLEKTHRINLTNTGNVSGHYNLRAASTTESINFTFLINNVPLPLAALPSSMTTDQDGQADTTSAVADESHTESAQKPASKPAPASVVPKNAGNVVKGAEKAAAKTGAAAGLLGMLGSILPGSVGKSLKQQSGALRNVQTKSKMVMDKPKEVTRKMDAFQQQSSRLAGGAKPADKPVNQSLPATSANCDEMTIQPKPKINVRQAVTADVSERLYQTKLVNPGEALKLDLKIKATKGHPEGSYSYKVISQLVPEGEFESVPPAVTGQGVVFFNKVAMWRLWFPNILSVVLISGILIGIAYSLLWLWR